MESSNRLDTVAGFSVPFGRVLEYEREMTESSIWEGPSLSVYCQMFRGYCLMANFGSLNGHTARDGVVWALCRSMDGGKGDLETLSVSETGQRESHRIVCLSQRT